MFVPLQRLNQLIRSIMENNKNKKMKGNEMMKGKYLNPKADLTFKLVFGEHKDLMMSLLNALLPLAEDAPIESLEYLSPEMVPETTGRKDSVVDVRCKDTLGRQFIVEMQMHWNENFKKRILLNASKSIIKQVGEGENYNLIEPVFSLNLINEAKFDSSIEDFYHDYAILNVAHPERTIDGLRFIFVELPKFQPRSIAQKKMAVLWLRFLTEIGESTSEAPAELLENEQTRKALSIVEKSAMNESQLYAYERFMQSIINEQVLLEGSYKEGEKHNSITIARKMKAKGLSATDIAEITGLTLSEIEKL